jgi:pimeloyl-ACP methyl ester carboxylesterase
MRLVHGRVELGLHELRPGCGPTLLLLHSLWGSSADWGTEVEAWPGAAYALDLSGHGSSGRVVGGSYSAEIFAGDADAALAHIGPAVVAGAGLGAYVALLLAGGRPDQVQAALLLPGVGLDGGGPLPGYLTPGAQRPSPAPEPPAGGDPFLAACATDVRPPDYARSFGERARRLLLAENGSERPAWWEVLRDCAVSESVPTDCSQALTLLAGRPPGGRSG